jgi:hypothetical protein
MVRSHGAETELIGAAALVALGDDGAIGVRLLQRHPRREQVPGHGPKRGLDLVRRYQVQPFALHDDLVNHGATQLIGVLIRVHALTGGVGSHRAEFNRDIGGSVVTSVTG